MTLFIAEKPELARAIALGLSGELKEQHKSHIIKGDCIITHAFGHILELAQPQSYNKTYEKWNLNDLPLNLPRPLKRVPKKEAKTQLKLIIDFINDTRVKEIVHCGDADEEGQILIDEILYYAKNTKSVKRCLINDLTPKAIAKAIENKKDNEEFKFLSESGFARSEADFLVGLNLTRFYTLINQSHKGGVVSVGRVQTPILGLIVHRELDFKNHKAEEYFALSANFTLNDITIKAPLHLDKEEKITAENKALEIKKACEGKEFEVRITKEDKKEHPPLPFNLLELQAHCSKLYGFSPDKTLKLTQNLRENHKAISYNRSDCQYLPESLHAQAPLIIETLKANFKEDIGQNNANTHIKSKAFDDSKLSAHYGIIPLETRLDLSQLNQDEISVYKLICKRFLMQFYAPCEYESFSFVFTLNDYSFQTSKRVDIKLGFKAEFKEEQVESDDKDYNALLNLNSALCESIESKKEQSKPLPLYTMTTLLKDLNKVSKYVKDENIKRLLREKDKDKKGESGGIGTPATRSTHIKTLIDREYIEVSKDKAQKIKATQKGIALIQSLPQILTQPDMTALWYEKQKLIQSNQLSREEFLKEIDDFILELISNNKGKTMNFSKNDEKHIPCPLCKEGNLREIDGKYGKFFSCSRYKEGCEFKAKSINNKPDLSPKEEIKPSKYQCPSCQKGFLIRRESKNKKGSFWYGCSEFKNDCKFICYEKEGKPDIKI